MQKITKHSLSKNLRYSSIKHYFKDFFDQPEKVFLLLAAIFGLAMVFSMPIFMTPDETVHFDRAYQVGEGQMLSETKNGETGGIVPYVPSISTVNGSQIPPIPRHQYFTKVAPSDIKFEAFPASAVYSPVGYIPQAVGIDLGRIIYPSLGVMVILGRIFNLIAYVALIYLAIKIAPRKKWVYAVVGLFPVAIQEAASLSTDVMTIGLSFITIAFIHKLFLQKEPIRRYQYLYIALIGLGLGLTKQTYIVLLLPIIFLPKNVLTGLKKRAILVACGLGISIFVAASWYLVIKYQHYVTYSKVLGVGDVNQVAQLKYILEHPLTFAKTLYRTFIFQGFKNPDLPDFYWTSMYGYFSWFAYALPAAFVSLGYAALLIAFLYKGNSLKDFSRDKMTAIAYSATFIISILAIAVSLYILWTPVGYYQVLGIQGRYFIPILPLLIPIFVVIGKWAKITFDKSNRMGIIVAGVSVINLTASILLTLKYFP
jgi:uncharacterized membrane protein